VAWIERAFLPGRRVTSGEILAADPDFGLGIGTPLPWLRYVTLETIATDADFGVVADRMPTAWQTLSLDRHFGLLS
jgi:hypothetical protein